MSYRGPNLQCKVRKGVTSNSSGDSFVITIPKFIATQFEGVLLRIYVSGNAIVMESGCKLVHKDIDLEKIECYDGGRVMIDEYGNKKVIR